MKQIRRRTARAILVPVALFVLVLGSVLPASAAPIASSPEAPAGFVIRALSLNW
jgi:hypothetical protein